MGIIKYKGTSPLSKVPDWNPSRKSVPLTNIFEEDVAVSQKTEKPTPLVSFLKLTRSFSANFTVLDEEGPNDL